MKDKYNVYFSRSKLEQTRHYFMCDTFIIVSLSSQLHSLILLLNIHYLRSSLGYLDLILESILFSEGRT